MVVLQNTFNWSNYIGIALLMDMAKKTALPWFADFGLKFSSNVSRFRSGSTSRNGSTWCIVSLQRSTST